MCHAFSFSGRAGMCSAGLTTVVCSCVHRTHAHARSYIHAIVPLIKHKGTCWFHPSQNCDDEEPQRLQLALLKDVIGEGLVANPKVARTWEVIENSTSGADGSARRGSICPLKWCKHNTQGVRDTIPSLAKAWEGCWGDSSWNNCEIVHVSRSFRRGDRGEQGCWKVSGGGGGVLCGLWTGAVVSSPTELHSAVSHCCLLTKMAPNASPCEIPC